MSEKTKYLEDLPLMGDLAGSAYEGWSEEIKRDFQENAMNPRVGLELLSESDKVRVWEIRLKPGERVGAHRHVLNYFWTALTPGRSRQRTYDGTTREGDYYAGETRHYVFEKGEFLLHDLENIGDTDLHFMTVEFLDSPNEPLPI